MKRTGTNRKNSKRSKSLSSAVFDTCDMCNARCYEPQIKVNTWRRWSVDEKMFNLCKGCAACHFCDKKIVDTDELYTLIGPRAVACSCCATWCIVCKQYVSSHTTLMIAPGVEQCCRHPTMCSLCNHPCDTEFGALDLRDNYSCMRAVACTNCAWHCGCDAVHLKKDWEVGHCWRTVTDACTLCKKSLPHVRDEAEAVAAIRQRGLRWYHLECVEKSDIKK